MKSFMSRNLFSLFALAFLSSCGGSSDDSGPSPTADFSVECVDFVCRFDASASSGNGSAITRYSWQFGDGSSGSGEEALHAYEFSDELTVGLKITTTNGSSSAATRTINVKGSPVAPAFSIIHDIIALQILMDEFMHEATAFTDAVQELAESNGSPANEPYELNCSDSGTTTIMAWQDANSNTQIDNNEQLEFSATSCDMGAGFAAMTTRDSAVATGDFDSTTFKLTDVDSVAAGISMDRYNGWGVSGNLEFVVDTAANPDVLSYSGTETALAFGDASGNLLARVSFTANLNSTVPALSGISGDASFTLSSREYEVEILETLGFTDSQDGSIRLAAGRFTIAGTNETIEIKPDTDPAYLRISIDISNDGDIDLTGRVAQSVSVERLND